MTAATPTPLPCPFCGESPTIYETTPQRPDSWYCGCENIDCQIQPGTDLRDTKVNATADWNRRVEVKP